MDEEKAEGQITREDFISFLEEHGIKEKFIQRTEEAEWSIHRLCDTVDRHEDWETERPIAGAFAWGLTPEGHDWWNEVAKDWIKTTKGWNK